MIKDVIIACEGQHNINILTKSLSSRSDQFIISSTITSLSALEDSLSHGVPSLIILDMHLIASDIGCDYFKKLRKICGYKTQLIVLGPEDFSVCQAVSQIGMVFYLPYRGWEEQFEETLDKVSTIFDSFFSKLDASRSFYISDKNFSDLQSLPMTIDQLNLAYGTNFQNGCFQMLFIKFDSPIGLDPPFRNNPAFLKRVTDYTSNYFKDLCSDIIFEPKDDGTMALLNFPPKNKQLMSEKVMNLRDHLSLLMHGLDQNFNITLCVSKVVEDVSQVWEIKEQARDTEWARMHFGLNRIIFWNELSEDKQEALDQHLTQLYHQIDAAIQSLNISRFQAIMNEFYSLPSEQLCSHSARMFCRQTLSQLFQTYWDTIKLTKDPAEAHLEISYQLHTCTTFERHKIIFLSSCVSQMNEIISQNKKGYSWAVRQAFSFVKSNINKPIDLETIASEVGLSKVYFSHLFKKETGQDFSQYVREYKNDAACKLLIQTNMTISAIANYVGINDVRSFSKRFRAMNGSTPSAYRKLHQVKLATKL